MEIIARVKKKTATFKGKSEAHVLAQITAAARQAKTDYVEITSVRYDKTDGLDLYPRLFERLEDGVNSNL